MKQASTACRFAAVFLLAASFCFLSSASSAGTSFYSMSDRWEKRQAAPPSQKGEALSSTFQSALSEGSLALPEVPPPPALQKTLSEVTASGQPIELQLRQTLFVRSDTSVKKSLSTDENVVALDTVEFVTLAVTGTGIGNTYVHMWNDQGRSTFAVRVIPQKYAISAVQQRQLQEIEKNRSFKVGYNIDRSAFYVGDKFREAKRSSLDVTQTVYGDGDTPYGYLTAHGQTQKDRAKTVLTDAQAKLYDGKIGPLHNFTAAAGDSTVTPDLLVFPRGRVRGGDLDVWNDSKNVRYHSFYGREQSSIIGTLSPGIVSDRTRSSFLSGNTVDWKWNDRMRWKGGYFTGSGRARPDELNRRSMGLKGRVDFTPNIAYEPDMGFDDEHVAQKQALTWQNDVARVKTEYRNIGETFETMVGAPSRQGELGNLTTVDWKILPYAFFSGSSDIFRDRLIPNPDNMDKYNVHLDMRLALTPWEKSSVILTYQNLDDTGRLGPSKQESMGAQFSHQFELWGHHATFFTRYLNRDNEVLNSPLSNYTNNQWVLGFYVPILWNVNFSLEQEYNWLHEPNASDTLTHPSATTYSFDRSGNFGNTPISYDIRLRIRDEEETESSNSFMTGEDSAELSGGLRYRQGDNWEVFMNGSLEQFVKESENVAGPRIEMQFLTGMRYLADTGYHWMETGNVEGFVFKDLNGDGMHQPEEPGLEKMLVISADGRKAETDNYGHYAIQGLSGKKIIMNLDPSRMPYGYVPTISSKQEKTLVNNGTVQIDFGLTPRSEITGVVFNDLDGNGKYDLTDAGLRKIKLLLEDGKQARTNSIGVYTFSDTLAGPHTVSLDLKSLPEGYLPQTALKRDIVVQEGLRYELNFAMKATRSVTGRVFHDTNLNGHMDTDEKPVSGVTVKLGTQTSRSDKDGWYLFDAAEPGSYHFEIADETLPAGLRFEASLPVTISKDPVTVTGQDLPLTGSGDETEPPVAEVIEK